MLEVKSERGQKNSSLLCLNLIICCCPFTPSQPHSQCVLVPLDFSPLNAETEACRQPAASSAHIRHASASSSLISHLRPRASELWHHQIKLDSDSTSPRARQENSELPKIIYHIRKKRNPSHLILKCILLLYNIHLPSDCSPESLRAGHLNQMFYIFF